MPYIGTDRERGECPSFCKAQKIETIDQLKEFFEKSGEELNLTLESFESYFKQPKEMWLGTWVEVPKDQSEPTETAVQMEAERVKMVHLDGMGGHYAEIEWIWLWEDSQGNHWINAELFC